MFSRFSAFYSPLLATFAAATVFCRMRMIVGLEDITRGDVLIGGERGNDVGVLLGEELGPAAPPRRQPGNCS